MTYKVEHRKLQFSRIGAITTVAALIPVVLQQYRIAFVMIGVANIIGWGLLYFTQKDLIEMESKKQ